MVIAFLLNIICILGVTVGKLPIINLIPPFHDAIIYKVLQYILWSREEIEEGKERKGGRKEEKKDKGREGEIQN